MQHWFNLPPFPELGIFHVIFKFGNTVVAQNVKTTWKISGSAYPLCLAISRDHSAIFYDDGHGKYELSLENSTH